MKTKLTILSSNDILFNIPLHQAIYKDSRIDLKKIYILKENHNIKKKIKILILLKIWDFFKIFKKYIKSILMQNRLSIYEAYANINSIKFINSINSINSDLIVCINCPQILNEKTISKINSPIYNFHPGDIPRFRGVLIPYYLLKEKKNKACMTFHKIDKNIDKGIILNKSFLNLNSADNIFSIYEKLFLSDESKNFILSCIINHKNLSNMQTKGIDKYYTYPSFVELIKFKLRI